MKDITNIPSWFNESETRHKLSIGKYLTQDELKVIVDFYTNYQFRGEGYWEAYVTLGVYKLKIKYYRIDGENVYEQPETM